jgi:hypothetical protein
MAIDVDAIVDAVASHAAATGHYESVNWHQPRVMPQSGMKAAVWLERITPVRSSGLAQTSVLVVLTLRQYQAMQLSPFDMIDPNMVKAASALMAAYSGDFTLGGTIRNVDLLGANGQSLEGQSGYLEVDGAVNRIFDITIPLVVNDTFEQSP